MPSEVRKMCDSRRRAVRLVIICCLLIPIGAPLGITGDAASWPFSFRDVPKDAGLLEPLAGIVGHGGAWGDFDGDGLIDLFVGGFCDRPDSEYKPAAGPVPSRLFRNLGNGKFEEVKDTPLTFFG